MGCWGPGIFEDDDALDIRDAFDTSLPDIGIERTISDLTARWLPLLADYGREDTVWLALAACCLRHEIAHPLVSARALVVCETSKADEFFDPNNRARRLDLLQQFRWLLASTQTGGLPPAAPSRGTLPPALD